MSTLSLKKTTSDAAGDIWPDDRLERCVLNIPSRRSCRRRDRQPSSDASQNAGACCRRERLFCRIGSIPTGRRPPSESSRVENLRKLPRHPCHQSLAGIGGGGGRSHALKTADTGVFRIITRAHKHAVLRIWLWKPSRIRFVWHTVFAGVAEPDPDPDPQYPYVFVHPVSGSGSYNQAKIVRIRYLNSYCFVTFVTSLWLFNFE